MMYPTTISTSYAYNVENHYWLKFYLALNCDFPPDEAYLIAVGDWSVDENSSTQPLSLGDGGPYLLGGSDDTIKSRFHALPVDSIDDNPGASNQKMKQRQHELYQEALNEDNNKSTKLLYFGQYLHYLEDKWSHWGYSSYWGHGPVSLLSAGLKFFGFSTAVESPDSTHVRPEHYQWMIFDSMISLGKLAEDLGYKTDCTTDLPLLDYSHGTAEYGDFPWYSPLEFEKASAKAEREGLPPPPPITTEEIMGSIRESLDQWDKESVIIDNLIASQQSGNDPLTSDQDVIDSILDHISGELGLSPDEITTEYEFHTWPWDENGTTTITVPPNPEDAVDVLKNRDQTQTSQNIEFEEESFVLLYDPNSNIITGSANVVNLGKQPSPNSMAMFMIHDISRNFHTVYSTTEIPSIPPEDKIQIEFSLKSENSLIGRPIILDGVIESNKILSENFVSYSPFLKTEKVFSQIPMFIPTSVEIMPNDSESQNIIISIDKVDGNSAQITPRISLHGETYVLPEKFLSLESGSQKFETSFTIQNFENQFSNPLVKLELYGITDDDQEFHFVFPMIIDFIDIDSIISSYDDNSIGEKTKGKPAKDENKTSPGKEKKESRGLITGDLIWPYNADGSRMTDEEAMAYWGAAGYNELAIENAIAVREADRINGVDPPEQIEPDMVTTPPLKEPKGKGPKGVEQQGALTPSGNYLPPVKQMKMGIMPQEVLCNEGMELIFKSSDGSPKCVSMVAAEKLVERGWATR